MKSLRLLQQDFQNYILSGTESILNQAIGTEKVSAKTRLNIYADGYRLRLTEILETSYPGIQALLGADDPFPEMGRAYIAAHPSPHFNVRWYGDCLAEFLASSPPYRDRPILAEMAAFEWAMALSFDAADQKIAGIEEVSQIPPETWPNMVFQPHPVVQRLDFRWNVPAIWKAVDAKTELEAPRGESFAVPWVIWRRERKVYFRSLNADEAWALDVMMTGATFGEICEGLCEWVDESQVALHAAEILKRWLADGLIEDVTYTR